MAEGRPALIAAALALVLFAAAPAKPAATAAPAKAVDGPVAVLPFRNLNDDPKFDYLKAGIAETMISDLKKTGKIAVVERDQIDRALTEIALAAKSGEPGASDDVRAVKVGRLVGAKTIVLGSYQHSGTQLRINARFVTVETGLVLDAAKATGTTADPFALQDKIVAVLLGVPADSPALPKRKPAKPKTAEAYRLYAMALTVANDADRVGYLKQSIEADPDFTYALEDLAALEKRMGVYAEASNRLLPETEMRALAIIENPKTPDDARVHELASLIGGLLMNRRYQAIVDLAPRVIDRGYPPASGMDPSEYLSFCRVVAYHHLRKWDLALQFGEEHLKRFGGGNFYAQTETEMRSIIDTRETWAKRRPEYEKDLAESRERFLDSKTGVVRPEHQLDWDWAPCIATIWTTEENELMLANCSEFVSKYSGTKDEDAAGHLTAARAAVVRAEASMGDFGKAKAHALALMEDTHEEDAAMRALLATFPND